MHTRKSSGRLVKLSKAALVAPVGLAPAALAVDQSTDTSAVPSSVSVEAAKNFDWVVATYAPEFFAGATVDETSRTVTVYTSPKFESDDGMVVLSTVISEMERRLDLFMVDEKGEVVPRDKSEKYALKIVSVDHSAIQMQGLRDRVAGLSDKVVPSDETWISQTARRVAVIKSDVESGKMLVEVVDLQKSDTDAALEAFGDTVVLSNTTGLADNWAQATDGPPHYANAGIKGDIPNIGISACTSGFTMAKNGARKMITAGHCLSGTWTAMNSSSSFGTTESIREAASNSNHYDFQSISGSTYDPRFYRANGTTIATAFGTWQNAPNTSMSVVKATGTQGSTVTFRGAHYGDRAYSIIDTNVCATLNGGLTCGLTRVSHSGACVNGPGDSGGPVSALTSAGTSSAVGLINGGGSISLPGGGYLCQAYYTPIETIGAEFSLSVVLG